MSASRGNGKRVSGIEMGFIICQALAGMMLLGILMQFISAKLTFEAGVEYLPVTITWTGSESRISTYMEDGKEQTKTTYDNSYCYTVNGVEYNDTVAGSRYSVTPGSQRTWYYNPNDPREISEWSSAEEMMGGTTHVWVIFVIFQILAIFFLIKVQQKKNMIKADQKIYEERIRRDIEKNKEIYRSLNRVIDGEKIFASLEPLRSRIYKNQKKAAHIISKAQVGGSLVAVLVKIIDAYRLHKLQEKLDVDQTAFYLEYKKNIAEPILKQFFGEFQYRPSQGFSSKELSDFQLLSGFSRRLESVISEDYIEGVYKGVGYRQADVKEKKRADDSELLAETERLHGRISVYQFQKNLNGHIVIKSQGSTHVDVRNMKKVEMENILFNRKFDVYTTNEQMAYYLLTPQFMEYLLNLDVRRETAFRFSGNNIVLFRNGINGIFEADMSQPLDIQYEIGKSYNELKEILDFVDVLNLDKVAEEANLRALYQDEESAWEDSVVMDEEKTSYGVVDMEDSVFGGPEFENVGEEQDIGEEDNLENWNKPASSEAGSSGLRLKL